MENFLIKFFKIYTLNQFVKDIDNYPLMWSQLNMLELLQSKASFDFDKKTLTMTTEFVDYYIELLQLHDRSKCEGLTYKGFKIIEIPNVSPPQI